MPAIEGSRAIAQTTMTINQRALVTPYIISRPQPC
jgi:hypothetical protein